MRTGTAATPERPPVRDTKEVASLSFIDKDYDWRGRMPGILKRAAVRTVIIALLGVFLVAGLAFAADPTGVATGGVADVVAKVAGNPTLVEVAQDLGHLKIGTNLFFLIVGVALIFFMQAGFMLVETGFCRAKNAANIAAMNLGIFTIGALAYWLLGFGLQMGGAGALATLGGADGLSGTFEIAKGWGIFGTQGFMLGGNSYDVGIAAMFLFQMVFMDTAATIPTGAMAERWKFSSFAIYGAWMAGLVYPVYAMWVWGGGWLAKLGTNVGLGHGVLDFAGSSVVHAIGGFVGLAGILVIGPRIGKFNKDGSPNAIPGHHLPMAILGTIVLVFGWIGFNGMSTLAATDFRFTMIITNTLMAATAGSFSAWMLVWKLWGKPDPSMIANGMLAGLVAITAPCAFVSPLGAVIIGLIAGLLVVGGVAFVERVLKADDPVGAVAVHGFNGLWGMLALGLFADGTYGDGFNGVAGTVRGLFYGGGVGQLSAQLIAVVVVVAWAFGLGYAFFKIQDAFTKGGIRSTPEDELAGLDATEMGVLAYPDFIGATGQGSFALPEAGTAKAVQAT
jgi:Amt family ammonium transporter